MNLPSPQLLEQRLKSTQTNWEAFVKTYGNQPVTTQFRQLRRVAWRHGQELFSFLLKDELEASYLKSGGTAQGSFVRMPCLPVNMLFVRPALPDYKKTLLHEAVHFFQKMNGLWKAIPIKMNPELRLVQVQSFRAAMRGQDDQQKHLLNKVSSWSPDKQACFRQYMALELQAYNLTAQCDSNLVKFPPDIKDIALHQAKVMQTSYLNFANALHWSG